MRPRCRPPRRCGPDSAATAAPCRQHGPQPTAAPAPRPAGSLRGAARRKGDLTVQQRHSHLRTVPWTAVVVLAIALFLGTGSQARASSPGETGLTADEIIARVDANAYRESAY